jgi:hypothetical protein
MKRNETNADPAALALAALGWTLSDEARADRLLALTGLSPDDLRQRLDEPGLLAAILGFLEAHEPDLLACAAALDLDPEVLVAARMTLEQQS